MLNNNFFLNKKVVITGSTGFKGSWLSIWLDLLGAKIYGIALDPPTNPSLFEKANLNNIVENNIIDIKDTEKVINTIKKIEPDYIFHLAAQPIVSISYLRTVETWNTNVIGTINILESLRLLNNECIGIIITSDKCYENQEWEWGYRENDLLGGKDPYSASKGSAELAFSSYHRSFFSDNYDNKIKICSARAGNVIGGGDWADNRIVPDCIKAWINGNSVDIKSPESTRPFQHVLEPLNGYITLAEKLKLNKKLAGHSFNFGPPSNFNFQVIDVVKELSKKWNDAGWKINEKQNNYSESKLLKLNCDKALSLLNWEPILDFKTTIDMTSDWYYSFYNIKNLDVLGKCRQQIKDFMNKKFFDQIL